MFKDVETFLGAEDVNSAIADQDTFATNIDNLGRKAFVEGDADALLDAHRILYIINMAGISVPWEMPVNNVCHPFIAKVKYILDDAFESASINKHDHILSQLPSVKNFESWVTEYVQSHPSNVVHPIFPYLRDDATYSQLKEFFFQETPLEMLFGDIVAMMLPGVYGQTKVELVKNFWDELGHAKDEEIHRNLRASIMKYLDIPTDSYLSDYESLVTEELALINLYLCLAHDRSKLTQLVGIMLSTELMIPGRFQFQIEGWRRVGVDDSTLRYLIDHTVVDVEHAEDWLNEVVVPMVEGSPHLMNDLMLGVVRRLDSAGAVCDRLLEHIKGFDDDTGRKVVNI
jgi:hypothetical protein